MLRGELEALRETLKPEQYQQALKGLNLAETLALENLDTEKFDAISAEAQKQVTAINTDIENLTFIAPVDRRSHGKTADS